VTDNHSAPASAYAPSRPTNILAIISLVASCIGFTVPGVIMGHIALYQIKKSGEQGHGLALAGVIVGYSLLAITLVLIVVYVLVFVGLFVWMGNNASNFKNFG
jgi:peptidyl-prolyl cis-trans isomerase B (cyclophilin B)